MRTTSTTRPMRARLTVVLAVLLSLCATMLAVLPQQADAAGPASAHDSIGGIFSVSPSDTGITVVGWAADPDSLDAPVTAYALLDGRRVLTKAITDEARPVIAKRHGTGPTPGFTLEVPVPAGRHMVCIAVRNLGAGMDGVLRCISTPLGRALPANATTWHDPHGKITNAWSGPRRIQFTGSAWDPDLRWRRTLVVLYVDGSPVATVPTHHTATPLVAHAGYRSSYQITVPTLTPGTHTGCIWVVNVGWGSNDFQGCRTVDSYRTSGHLPYTQPTAANAKVVAFAKKQLGKPYVWGATGMKAFDCSGLVQRAYASAGVTTPRVSEDQRVAARVIPASHARPGDLVFYHDSLGDTYHVGIYLSPGVSLAAIDPAEGVDYQNIWDPDATYGSFTHT